MRQNLKPVMGKTAPIIVPNAACTLAQFQGKSQFGLSYSTTFQGRARVLGVADSCFRKPWPTDQWERGELKAARGAWEVLCPCGRLPVAARSYSSVMSF